MARTDADYLDSLRYTYETLVKPHLEFLHTDLLFNTDPDGLAEPNNLRDMVDFMMRLGDACEACGNTLVLCGRHCKTLTNIIYDRRFKSEEAEDEPNTAKNV